MEGDANTPKVAPRGDACHRAQRWNEIPHLKEITNRMKLCTVGNKTLLTTGFAGKGNLYVMHAIKTKETEFL